MSDTFLASLHALWRTERIIADIKLRHLLGRIGLGALAIVSAAFGLAMLEFAGYLLLLQSWNAVAASTILGLLNFALTLVLIFISAKLSAARELELAIDVQKIAIRNLQKEANLQINRYPLASLLPVLLPSIIDLVLRHLRKDNAGTTPAAPTS